MKTNKRLLSVAVTAVLLSAAANADPAPSPEVIERGRYIAAITGCNDCHTSGYPEGGGTIPMEQWLTGSNVGFSGPWGTSYPSNLRLRLHEWTEQQWLEQARMPRRPPMPWFSLRDMSDEDLKALYWFVRSLGPAGVPAPAHVPPGQAVNTPYYDFVPKEPRRQAMR